MKKRRAPLALAAALILVIGAVTLANLPKAEHAETQSQDEVQQGVQRETPTKGEMAELVRSTTDSKAAKGGLTPMGATGISPTPTILLPDASMYLPEPSDTSVPTQWYAEDSGLEKSAKKAKR
jgi:hypothetical protein